MTNDETTTCAWCTTKGTADEVPAETAEGMCAYHAALWHDQTPAVETEEGEDDAGFCWSCNLVDENDDAGLCSTCGTCPNCCTCDEDESPETTPIACTLRVVRDEGAGWTFDSVVSDARTAVETSLAALAEAEVPNAEHLAASIQETGADWGSWTLVLPWAWWLRLEAAGILEVHVRLPDGRTVLLLAEMP